MNQNILLLSPQSQAAGKLTNAEARRCAPLDRTMKSVTGLRGLMRNFFVFAGAKTLWQSHRDLKVLILLRMVRLLGHGGTTLILAVYLHGLGLEDSDVGLFMTLTLIGDLVVSFGLTYVGDAMGVRLVAIIGSLLMCAAGVAFANLSNFWLLLLAAVFGVVSPRRVFYLVACEHYILIPTDTVSYSADEWQCQRN